MLNQKQVEYLIEKKVYEVFTQGLRSPSLNARIKKLMEEIRDTDEAVQIYKKEKRTGKLKKIKSLSDIF